jgi:hypothetical protein
MNGNITAYLVNLYNYYVQTKNKIKHKNTVTCS